MRVLICGGGAIGASIAYFLSLRQVEAVVIERTGVGSAASGKSGGFLALDWCDGTPLGPLARRSFALHGELAASSGRDWGYRRLETLAIALNARHRARASNPAGLPDWVAPEARLQQRLGTAATTAQVDPAGFTRGLMAAAIERGASLQTGSVTGMTRAPSDGRVTGVLVDGEPVAGDAVVIAMGPWSVLAAQWLPLPAVYGLKGHSLVFRGREPVSAHALFVEYQGEDGAAHAPEVFPRPDDTTYVCGLSNTAPVPLDPAAVAPDPGALEQLRAITARFAPALGAAEIVAAQACYRPVTADGLPLIGPVPGVEAAYVATGHSVWGMLNAPATGEAIAGLIVDGRAGSVDLGAFDPARLPPLPAEAVGT
jgi:glycine/D-amino acid oxidase-like deaminating enzyme